MTGEGRGRWIGLALVGILAALLAFLNAGERVVVNLGFVVVYRVPLVPLVLTAFIIGMVAMYLLGLPHDLRVRKALRDAGIDPSGAPEAGRPLAAGPLPGTIPTGIEGGGESPLDAFVGEAASDASYVGSGEEVDDFPEAPGVEFASATPRTGNLVDDAVPLPGQTQPTGQGTDDGFGTASVDDDATPPGEALPAGQGTNDGFGEGDATPPGEAGMVGGVGRDGSGAGDGDEFPPEGIDRDEPFSDDESEVSSRDARPPPLPPP